MFASHSASNGSSEAERQGPVEARVRLGVAPGQVVREGEAAERRE